MSKQLSIALCAKNRLFRDGVLHVLRSLNCRVLAVSNDLGSLDIVSDKKFILIIEEKCVDDIDVRAIFDIKQRCQNCLIVILLDAYSHDERSKIESLGVSGVLLTSITSEALVASLGVVMMGEHVFSMPNSFVGREATSIKIPSAYSDSSDLRAEYTGNTHQTANGAVTILAESSKARLARRGELSARETEILACLVAGYSNKVIARRCRIAEATVKVHLKAILRKTEVVNRTQAAIWAINNNMTIDASAEPRRVGERF